MQTVAPAVVVLFLAAAAAGQGVPDLARARDLLQQIRESEVQEGVKICVAANDVPAVELLLEVFQATERRTRMHLAPGHYRDIVWDGLTKITDHYARRRVEHELAKGRDPRVRQWCAELLGIYGDAGFGETLRKALAAKDDDLQRHAAQSLGMLRFAAAATDLASLARHANEYVRGDAILALARIDRAHVPAFVKAIAEDRSGGVRCALLGAAAEVCPDDVETLSDKALRDPDWRPRLQAVSNLGRIKTRTAVDSLIGALADGRPVVAARAMRELQELTGQPIRQADVWRKWWADHRETFAFPDQRGGAPAPAAGGTVAYNGVPVDSDHVAFLLDKSYAMKQRLQSKGVPKEEAAVAELERVLAALDGKITFQVVNYHVAIETLGKKPTPLNERSRKRAIAFAKAPSDGREKDIWQALFTVVPDATLDTVYLLSSGEPDTGLYVHWNRVTRHLADLNRFHKVVVHTVAYTDNEWYRDQLQKIAEVTGGHCEWIK